MRTLRQNPYYRIVLWAACAICLVLVVWLASTVVLRPDWLLADDFVEYWSAGRLNLEGGNPYNPVQLLDLQNQAGRDAGEAVMMWNPPWTLLVAMPLGLLSYPASRTLWLLLNIAFVLLGVDLLWRVYGGSSRLRWVGWLLGFSFVPVLDALKKGQTGILVLLGIVGFLYFVGNKRPWLAGLSLALLAIKPHLAYLFLLAVVFWAFHRRVWAVLAGFVMAITAAALIALVVNPQVFSQYLFAIGNFPPTDWATPTLGGVLRLAFGPDRFWLQFLPSLAGVLWLLALWAGGRAAWDWPAQAPAVVLVSLLTAAYGWSFDQPAALAAVIPVFATLTMRPWNVYSFLVLGSYALVNVLVLVTPNNEIYFFWVAPALLVWYLASRWLCDKQSERPPRPQQLW
jgi:hypothetical protein